MTTPAYTNVSGAFPAVRYYTQFDPYFYTVDNRPLGDLASVDGVVASGVDASIRSSLIGALKDSVVFRDLYGTAGYTTGLDLSNPSANTLRVGPGAMYGLVNLTASDSRQVVKQAILPSFVDFAIPAPLTVGQSVVYLVQGQYVDFGATTSGTFPFYDLSNTRLPSTLLNGELQLQLVTGVAAATGTQTTPSPTAGWTPLFVVTVDYGQTTSHYHSYAANAPASKGYRKVISNLTNVTTTTAAVGDVTVTAFADAATQGVRSSIVIDSTVNPYKAIQVKMDYAPSATGGAFVARLKYQIFSATGLLSPASYTVGSNETITVSGAASSLASYTFTTLIPGYMLAGNAMVVLVVERVGADGADTNTGVLNLVNLTAFQ